MFQNDMQLVGALKLKYHAAMSYLETVQYQLICWSFSSILRQKEEASSLIHHL